MLGQSMGWVGLSHVFVGIMDTTFTPLVRQCISGYMRIQYLL